MPISKRLAMSEDLLNDLMMKTWNMRIATIGPGVEINLTPNWFGWAEGKIFYVRPRPESGQCSSQPGV